MTSPTDGDFSFRRFPSKAKNRAKRALPYAIIRPGEVPERPNGAVSKTVVVLRATVGSNPTLSATQL